MRGGPAPGPSGGAGPDGTPFSGGMPGGFSFGGMPGGGGARTFHFSTGPGGGGSGFRFSSADDIFRNFAKASGGMGGGGGGFDDDDIFSMLNGGLGGGGGPRARASRGPGGFAQSSRRGPTPEPTVVEKELPLTLEELMRGTTKKVTVKSKTFDSSGKRTVQDVVLEANIKPGLRTGSKIKYRGVGDQEEGGRQDVHLIVTEVCNFPLPNQEPDREMLTIRRKRTPTSNAAGTTSSPPSISTSRRPSPAGTASCARSTANPSGCRNPGRRSPAMRSDTPIWA